MDNDLDKEYSEVLDSLILNAVLVCTAHRLNDADAVFALLDKLTISVDRLTELTEEICDDEEE